MILYLPAIFALLIKLALLIYAGKDLVSKRLSPLLFSLLFFLTICNILEIGGIAQSDEPDSVEIFLRIYYVSLVLLFAFLLHLSVLIMRGSVNRIFSSINLGLNGLLCLSILFTDMVVAGIASIGYSVTRVPGEHYWWFQVQGVLVLLGSILFSLTGFWSADTPFKRIQALYILIGIVFLTVPLLVVITLMALGFKINAALIFPVGVSVFLVFSIYAIKNSRLFDLRILIPFTEMYKLHRQRIREYRIAADGSEWSAAERRSNHEKVYFRKLLLDNNFNQTAVAKILNVSTSTVSKKRKEYKI